MIAYCGCVAADSITVHSGCSSISQAANPKPRILHSFLTRNVGAQTQDSMYGKGMRVHNLLRRQPHETQRARCTICANVKNV